jgi:hypothetical protein
MSVEAIGGPQLLPRRTADDADADAVDAETPACPTAGVP